MRIDNVRIYGALKDHSIIEAIYEDELEDTVWAARDPSTTPDWLSIIRYLRRAGMSNLIELTALN